MSEVLEDTEMLTEMKVQMVVKKKNIKCVCSGFIYYRQSGAPTHISLRLLFILEV